MLMLTARAFVGPEAIDTLVDMALDARVDAGHVRYFLVPQG